MTKQEKSIELRPVSKEEVDRILNGEMIELSNVGAGLTVHFENGSVTPTCSLS